MASGKLRFAGNNEIRQWKGFRYETKKKIKDLFPNVSSEIEEFWETSPFDDLIAEIEQVAAWAYGEVISEEKEGRKVDIIAELDNLFKRSESLRDDLRRLSPDVDRLFPPETEPLEWADNLNQTCIGIHHVLKRAKALPTKEHPSIFDRSVMFELAVQVLRIVKNKGMRVTATFNPDTGGGSPAVLLLTYIGYDIGLARAEKTWKTVIGELKKEELV